jgi:hypothetical protein
VDSVSMTRSTRMRVPPRSPDSTRSTSFKGLKLLLLLALTDDTLRPLVAATAPRQLKSSTSNASVSIDQHMYVARLASGAACHTVIDDKALHHHVRHEETEQCDACILAQIARSSRELLHSAGAHIVASARARAQPDRGDHTLGADHSSGMQVH